MKTVTVYLEGAVGKPKNPQEKKRVNDCRASFAKLFGMKHVVFIPCGGRKQAFDDFEVAYKNPDGSWPILLVDSEDEVIDESKIEHLTKRDGWQFPEGVAERQVQLMATCMESWLIYDREGLKTFYGSCLQESGLPSKFEMETRHRHVLFNILKHITRNCAREKVYDKGIGFKILLKADCDVLKELKYFKMAYDHIEGHMKL